MHGSHLPLQAWFAAIHIMTSHSNGISALQLQAELGLGSDKSAWLLLTKLRRAMVDPERSRLEGIVEIDETEFPLRRKDDPPAGGQDRSPQGKMFVAGAVELSPQGQPRRLRLTPIADFSAATLRPFVVATAAPDSPRRHRRLVRLRRSVRSRERSQDCRQDGRRCRAALDPPRLKAPDYLDFRSVTSGDFWFRSCR